MRGDPENLEVLAEELIVRGVSPNAFYTQFEADMKLHEVDSFQHSASETVQTVVFVSMTRALRPYLSQFNIFRPIARMCSAYVRTKEMQRAVAWGTMTPFFR